jgi:hypothetical protein
MFPILTTADKSYLAGLFDGEGTAGIWKSGHTKAGNRCRPCAAIGMCDLDPIKFFQLCFGGSLYVDKRDIKTNGKHKRMYLLSWRGNKEIRYLIGSILPFSKNETKISQLQACLNWFNINGYNTVV